MKKLALLVVFIFFISLAGLAQAKPSTRIVGGVNTTTASWPSIVSLVVKDSTSSYDGHFCGGSLIRKQWVLTAAHCAAYIKPNNTDAVLKRTNLRTTSGIRVGVSYVKKHPRYFSSTLKNDFALLKLSRPIKAGRVLRTANTPAGAGNTVRVAGWGVSYDSFPHILQETSVEVFSNSRCYDSYGRSYSPRVMFCAGREEGGSDSCQGDSGGPIVRRGRLVGVVSFGSGCGTEPGVYAKINKSISRWIANVVRAAPRTKSVRPGADRPFVQKRPNIDFIFGYEYDESANSYILDSSLSSNRSLSSATITLKESEHTMCFLVEGAPLCKGVGEQWPLTPSYGKRLWYATGATEEPCPVFQIETEVSEGGGEYRGDLDTCSYRSLVPAKPLFENQKIKPQYKIKIK